jgi:hypothetical protein
MCRNGFADFFATIHGDVAPLIKPCMRAIGIAEILSP